MRRVSGTGKAHARFEKYQKPSGSKSAFGRSYDPAADFTIPTAKPAQSAPPGPLKRKASEDTTDAGGLPTPTAVKKIKKERVTAADSESGTAESAVKVERKSIKKKKKKTAATDSAGVDQS